MDRDTQVCILKKSNLARMAGKVASFLKKGEICVIPTDTIYGIVALDRFPETVKEIYEVKRRPGDKPFIRLIGSMESMKLFTDQALPPSLRGYWPGPLTVIFRCREGGKIALRFPNDPFLKMLFSELEGCPLVAPSANVSGEEEIYECDKLARAFIGKVGLVLCAEEDLRERRASTIVDISEPEWKLIRAGSLNLDCLIAGTRKPGSSLP